MTPQLTLEYLADLELLGFSDESFWRLHHKRDNASNERETIAGMRSYCLMHNTFAHNGNNTRVARRLEFVLRVYSEWGLPNGCTKVFTALAEASYLGIPNPL